MRREWVVGIVSGFQVDFHLLCKRTSVDSGDGWVLDGRTRGTRLHNVRVWEREFLVLMIGGMMTARLS